MHQLARQPVVLRPIVSSQALMADVGALMAHAPTISAALSTAGVGTHQITVDRGVNLRTAPVVVPSVLTTNVDLSMGLAPLATAALNMAGVGLPLTIAGRDLNPNIRILAL